MKIAVLFGGTSEERDVSIASAAQIIPALRVLGHDVFAVDTATGRLPPADERQLLASGVAPEPPSSAAMEQVRGRAMAFVPNASDIRSAGVPTADWMMAPVQAADVESSLGWPVVVKPSKQGSTVGLSVVRQAADLADAITLAASFDDEVMVEKFIAGREFTVGVLDGTPLPVGEIISPGEVFDYQAKYQIGGAREMFPADLPPLEAGQLQEYALRAHRVLKLGAYSRIDFRRDANARFWCLEANSLPGMTATSLLPQAAKVAGISFPKLLERICKGAIRRV